jgi:hypothetical protein
MVGNQPTPNVTRKIVQSILNWLCNFRKKKSSSRRVYQKTQVKIQTKNFWKSIKKDMSKWGLLAWSQRDPLQRSSDGHPTSRTWIRIGFGNGFYLWIKLQAAPIFLAI